MSKKDPTKKELITELMKVQNLHTEESLNKLTKKQILAIAKEFGTDKVTPVPETPKAEDKELDTTPESEETPEPFVSFCNFDFDPKTKGTCRVECSIDNPEEFEKCLENFKTAEIKPKRKSKTIEKTGQNGWGRLLGSQADLIEQCLLDKEPMTTKDIAEFSNCTEARVRRHFLRLIHKEHRPDENGDNLGDVMKTAEGLIYLPWRFPELTGTSAYPKKVCKGGAETKPETDKAA